jgi:hemerythrin-like domain-containing protein
MTTTASVKISSDAKLLLDMLHQKLRATGMKVTEQKILDTLIEYTDLTQIKKLLQKEENVALTMLNKPVNWGVEDSSENIDKYVYGEIHEPSTRYLSARRRKKR